MSVQEWHKAAAERDRLEAENERLVNFIHGTIHEWLKYDVDSAIADDYEQMLKRELGKAKDAT